MRRLAACGLPLLWACNPLPPEVDEPGMTGNDGGSTTMESSSATTTITTTTTTPEPTGDPETADGGSGTGPGGCMDHDDCSDGVYCNGIEICDPAGAGADADGCVPAAEPACPTEGTHCDEETDSCVTECELNPDADGDGVDSVDCGGTDCNDSDPDVNPGLEEQCDRFDVDEDCDPSTYGTLDADADGMVSNECCNEGNCGPDCDDSSWGFGIGDWAHCTSCEDPCGAQQACEANACVTARRVFITSTTHDGELSGLFGADAICQARAEEAALGGTFMAYMVSPESGLDRLEHPAVPFVRLDGTRIANDWNDLSDESIQAMLNITEGRESVGGNAWTGLRDVGGSGLTNTCYSWTYSGRGCLSGGGCGAAGESDMVNGHWDGHHVFHCDSAFRLYCIEQ